MTIRRTATLYGLASVVFLSAIVAMIRSVSEYFGSAGGAALLYTVTAALLLIAPGRTRLRDFHPAYLLVGGGLFVAYELCFSQALGLASNHSQVLELGIVNYLWPSFTVLFAIPLNSERPGLLAMIGILLAACGIVWGVVGGEEGPDPTQTWMRIQSNPISYGLAFSGAVLWGFYCNVPRRWAVQPPRSAARPRVLGGITLSNKVYGGRDERKMGGNKILQKTRTDLCKLTTVQVQSGSAYILLYIIYIMRN